MRPKRNHPASLILAAIAAAAMLAGSVAFAQEQVGTIEGAVVDKDGAALPGVTVQAIGASGTILAITDIDGTYRFPRLLPGIYKLTAKLDGFVAAEYPNVELALGKVLKVNFTLQAGRFEDTITVAADSLAIDVTQSSTATSIGREQIELLPRGRDFTAVATLAAGASNEAFLGGISIDGSSGSENRFLIDGVDTTHPRFGTSGQNLVNEFVEEVQVKSAGYAAEYGGSTGGVISAITKTGANEWHGLAGVYFRNDAMIGDNRPFVTRDAQGHYSAIVYPKDDDTRWEPSLSLSGPVLRDKLWFFLAYQPAFQDVTRTVQSTGLQRDLSHDETYFTGNLKGNVGSRFLYKASVNLSPSKNVGALPQVDGSTNPLADLDITQKFISDSYSAFGDVILSDSFLLSGRVGYFVTDQHDSGFPNAPNQFFNPGPPDGSIPPELIRATGYTSNPSNTKVDFDKYERTAGGMDASWFFEAVGNHNLKLGVQLERLKNNVETGEINNLVRYRWFRADRFGLGVQGTYGSVEVRRFRTTGDISSENLGFFVQDSWSLAKNFTLNLGVRTEREQIPNYNPAYGRWAVKFNYGDKLAPRLGFAWDIAGDQKWKVYGSYGVYYDITHLELPRGSFGGDKWISYFYPLENPDWTQHHCNVVTNTTTEDPCGMTFGAPLAEILNLREPSTGENGGIDPGLKPYEEKEYQLGVDYQLTPQIVVGARYVNKPLVRAIEDIGYFATLPDGSSSEVYTIGNPGEGVTAQPVEGLPTPPKAKRDYQALELKFNKRFADNWLLNVAYTYSKLYGNYSGLASSDEFGRTSPNVNRFFDEIHNSFDEHGEPVFGRLNTDRPHALDLQAVYQFPFRLSVGLSQYYGSGTPISSQYAFAGVPFFAKGRMDQGRTPALTQTDLMLVQSFKIGGIELQASLNVLNLFDEDTVTGVGINPYDNSLFTKSPNCHNDPVCFFDQTPFDADANASAENNPRNPLYLQPNAWQAPRTMRVGVKISF